MRLIEDRLERLQIVAEMGSLDMPIARGIYEHSIFTPSTFDVQLLVGPSIL